MTTEALLKQIYFPLHANKKKSWRLRGPWAILQWGRNAAWGATTEVTPSFLAKVLPQMKQALTKMRGFLPPHTHIFVVAPHTAFYSILKIHWPSVGHFFKKRKIKGNAHFPGTIHDSEIQLNVFLTFSSVIVRLQNGTKAAFLATILH